MGDNQKKAAKLFDQSSALIKAGKINEAIEKLSQSLNAFITNAATWNQLAFCYIKKQDLPKAVDTILTGINLCHDNTLLGNFWQMIGLLKKNGLISIIARAFRRLVDMAPVENREGTGYLPDVALLKECVHNLVMSGDAEGAFDAYYTLEKLNPGQGDAWKNLALKCQENNKELEFMNFCLTVFDVTNKAHLIKDINKAWKYLAEACSKTNKEEDLTNVLSKIFDIDIRETNDFDNAFKILGGLFMERKDYEKALEVFKKLINKWPTCTDFYVKLGECYQNTNQRDEAIRAYTTATQLSPEDEHARQSLDAILNEAT